MLPGEQQQGIETETTSRLMRSKLRSQAEDPGQRLLIEDPGLFLSHEMAEIAATDEQGPAIEQRREMRGQPKGSALTHHQRHQRKVTQTVLQQGEQDLDGMLLPVRLFMADKAVVAGQLGKRLHIEHRGAKGRLKCTAIIGGERDTTQWHPVGRREDHHPCDSLSRQCRHPLRRQGAAIAIAGMRQQQRTGLPVRTLVQGKMGAKPAAQGLLLCRVEITGDCRRADLTHGRAPRGWLTKMIGEPRS
ncbi:hypothetical protein WL1483_3430 [Aeromonas schubertii]|uniref:Uncharacterized protein n=1 Tax=Aeromonas schubertii TaxID=652 RepID=A0A0S2SM95_9GAMM|nr:hypothetical protein WL1483_3430 [Aeromonas schubertii]